MDSNEQIVENASDSRVLEMLQMTISCLQQKNMNQEALACLEQSLWLQLRMFGSEVQIFARHHMAVTM